MNKEVYNMSEKNEFGRVSVEDLLENFEAQEVEQEEEKA